MSSERLKTQGSERLSSVERPYSVVVELREVDNLLINGEVGLSFLKREGESSALTLIVDREKSQFVSIVSLNHDPLIPNVNEAEKGKFRGVFVPFEKNNHPKVYIGKKYQLFCIARGEHPLGEEALWLQVFSETPITLEPIESNPRHVLVNRFNRSRRRERR